MNQLNKGDFVKVGNDIGVVVYLESEVYIPDDHVGIWYGEKSAQGNPRYRTVPTDYCEKVNSIEDYH